MSGVINTVQKTLAENFTGKFQELAPKGQHFALEDVPDLDGKVAVVTGGSQGIGYGCTHTLLSHNISKLYILSYSQGSFDSAVEAIGKQLGEDKAARTKWIQCDLSDWKRVIEVAKEIKNSTDRLDIIINNAAKGQMTQEITDYGVDKHMALNHMGHAVLISELLPLLKKTADQGTTVRIVNLASNAHQMVPENLNFDSLEEINKDLGAAQEYGRSKIAAILYSRYLARHLTKEHPNILVNASHPGFVSTKMSKEDIHEAYPLGGYVLSVAIEPFKKTQLEGCVSTIFAATATTESGQYICPPAIPEPGNAQSQDEQLGEQLMKLTREVVKEKAGYDMKDY